MSEPSAFDIGRARVGRVAARGGARPQIARGLRAALPRSGGPSTPRAGSLTRCREAACGAGPRVSRSMSDPSLALREPSEDEPAVASAMAAATPATTSLVLEAPPPVGPVTPTAANEAVPINAQDRARLDSMVASYLDAVSSL